MATAATTDLRPVLSESIRNHPELSRAAEAATEYLSGHIVKHPHAFGENRVVVWSYLPDHIDGPRVSVGYTEDDSYGHRHTTRFLRPDELTDPFSRLSQMDRLLQDVLGQRWRQVDKVSWERIRQLERGGTDADAD